MVNVELLQYWLELVSVKPVFVTTQLQFITDLSLPNWAVIVLYFRH